MPVIDLTREVIVIDLTRSPGEKVKRKKTGVKKKTITSVSQLTKEVRKHLIGIVRDEVVENLFYAFRRAFVPALFDRLASQFTKKQMKEKFYFNNDDSIASVMNESLKKYPMVVTPYKSLPSEYREKHHIVAYYGDQLGNNKKRYNRIFNTLMKQAKNAYNEMEKKAYKDCGGGVRGRGKKWFYKNWKQILPKGRKR